MFRKKEKLKEFYSNHLVTHPPNPLDFAIHICYPCFIPYLSIHLPLSPSINTLTFLDEFLFLFFSFEVKFTIKARIKSRRFSLLEFW